VIRNRITYLLISQLIAAKGSKGTSKIRLFRTETRISAIAETARVTIRSVMAVDRLTLTVIVHYINFITLIRLSANTLHRFKSRLDKKNEGNNQYIINNFHPEIQGTGSRSGVTVNYIVRLSFGRSYSLRLLHRQTFRKAFDSVWRKPRDYGRS